MLTALYPNFATFQDSLRSSEHEQVYERRYKLVSARHGCERPTHDDEFRLCRIKVRKEYFTGDTPKRVETNEEDGKRHVYVWRTPYSAYNTRLKAWVPVIDFNVLNCYPGHFLYTNENETTESYMMHRAEQQSLRLKMLDVIMNPSIVEMGVCPIPRFAADLMKRGAIAKNDCCPITLNPLKDCESITITDCYHLFDTAAIDMWTRRNMDCPACKQKITSKCIV